MLTLLTKIVDGGDYMKETNPEIRKYIASMERVIKRYEETIANIQSELAELSQQLTKLKYSERKDLW